MVSLALVKGHLERVGGEGGLKDARRGELVPDVTAAGEGSADGGNDFTALTLSNRSGLFGGADGLAVGGVVLSHCLGTIMVVAFAIQKSR